MRPLLEEDVDPDPIVQLAAWHRESGTDEMAVATVGPDGTPSLRMVLLRGLDERGLVFHTNYRSAKADDIEGGSSVACMMRWPPLRQARVIGPAVRISPEESDTYWRTRPRESQISAVASPQSRVVSLDELETSVARVRAEVGDGPVPRPEHWGGYRVAPIEVELWQQGNDRLHDRLRYRRLPSGWVLERLAP